MNELNIATFFELLNSDSGDNVLLEALRKLTEVQDPEAITEAKAPQKLGGWGGWGA